MAVVILDPAHPPKAMSSTRFVRTACVCPICNGLATLVQVVAMAGSDKEITEYDIDCHHTHRGEK